MATVAHTQKSSHDKIWFDLAVTDNGDDTITIAAGDIYVHGTTYAMSALTNQSIGTGPFLVSIEDLGGGSAGYKVDTVRDGTVVPVSFGEGIGALSVVWRDDGTDIHYLNSV